MKCWGVAATGAARIGPVDEHKVAVAASKGGCGDPACTDPSHLPARLHDHAAKEEHRTRIRREACADPTCTDPALRPQPQAVHKSNCRGTARVVADYRCCSQQGHPTHWLIRAQATRRDPQRSEGGRLHDPGYCGSRTTTATRRTTTRTYTHDAVGLTRSSPPAAVLRAGTARDLLGPCRPTSRRP